MKKNILVIFFLFIVSVWALKSLFGGPYYTSQDGIHQVSRLYYFKLALKDGVFPPRFSNTAYLGYGYPLFHFNYHLPWYASIPFFALKINEFVIIKNLHFIVYLLSGVFAYLFLKELVQQKFAALVGSILFMVSPYRFVNIYVRNALGEVFAMMFLPLVCLFILKISKKPKIIYSVFLSLSLTGLILSHAMSFVIFSPTFLLFFVFCFVSSRDKKKFFSYILIGAVIFAGLSAYYLFPAFIERKFTIFDMKFKNIFGRELLSFWPVLYSKWGYSGSGNLPEEVMSFQLGIANWLVLAASLFFLPFAFFKKKNNVFLFFLSILGVIFSVFLMLKPSIFFWQTFGKIFFVDFPWKMLGPAIFWGSILLSLLISNMKFKFKHVVFTLFIFLIFYANRNHIRVNKYISFDIPQAAYIEKSTNTEDEYLPKWLALSYFTGGFKTEFFEKNGAKIISSKGKIEKVKDKNQNFSYIFVGPKVQQTVRKFYFPGWNVYVNGKKIQFAHENGFFTFWVPKGQSKIEIRYDGTKLVQICNLVSFATFIAASIYLGVYFFLALKPKNKIKSK